MRVSIISDYLDPANWGGAARVAAEQAIALTQLGHNVTLIAASGSDLKVPGVKHHSWIRRGGLFSYWKQKKETLKYLSASKPELAILHQPLSASFVHTAAPELKTHYFFHSSWVDEVLSQGKKIGVNKRRSLELAALANSKKIFVTSPFTSDVLKRIAPDQINKTVENPLAVKSPPFCINSEANKKLHEKYKIPQDKKIICSFRRLIARTGLDLFVELIEQIPEAYGLIGGKGEDESKLKNLCVKKGLSDRINFLGYVKENEMVEILQGANLAVVPSKELEGFGLFTLEALASGCPVVATPVGNNSHLLKSCGLEYMLSSEISSKSLVNTANKILNNTVDAAALNKKVTKIYNWQQHAELLLL